MQKIMFNDKYGLTKAVLEGKKTQTRRLFSKHNFIRPFGNFREGKLYVNEIFKDGEISKYAVGEVLAVAQSYQMLWETEPDALICTEGSQVETYVAKHYPGNTVEQINRCAGWKNKMFVKADLMPHQIRITNIRFQRLQDISNDDCLKEGIHRWEDDKLYLTDKAVRKSIDELKAAGYDTYAIPRCWDCHTSPREAYAALIDKVSGKGTWEKNPWMFVYDFELVK